MRVVGDVLIVLGQDPQEHLALLLVDGLDDQSVVEAEEEEAAAGAQGLPRLLDVVAVGEQVQGAGQLLRGQVVHQPQRDEDGVGVGLDLDGDGLVVQVSDNVLNAFLLAPTFAGQTGLYFELVGGP